MTGDNPDGPSKRAIADNLRAFERIEGLSALEAAERFGVPYRTYRAYRKAELLPGAARRRHMAEVIGIPDVVFTAGASEITRVIELLRRTGGDVDPETRS